MNTGLLSYNNAIISADGRFRYILSRRWKSTGRVLGFLMLNPSKADASDDDPTIRRCTAFANSWGYVGIDVVNMFAYRSTSPNVLEDHSMFIGPMNDYYIEEFAHTVDRIICAWGHHRIARNRSRRVLRRLRSLGVENKLYCLGQVDEDWPRHPLFVPKFVKPRRFIIPQGLMRLRLIKR